jgi:hypothetical protein
VETHVKVLGILYILFSALALCIALFVMLALGGASAIVGANAPADDAAIAIPILGLTGMALVVIIMATALPGLIAGIGLLKRQNWARILTIVLSALNLINFPFGTILGAYGLWVTLNKETEQLFKPAAVVQS